MHAKSHQRGSTEKLVLAMVAAALGVVGFLAAVSLAHGATRSSATVSLRKTSLGMVLVGANGHTLYLFMKDRNDKSSCTSSCAQFWPPLVVKAKPTAGAGVQGSMLSTTKRTNGSLQVTYNKHPLYEFSLDKAAGQVKGEGLLEFGARWYGMSAKGAAILKSSSPLPPPATTSPGGTTTNPYSTPYP